MCDSNANTTTQTQTLPGGLTNAIDTASSGALSAYNAGNPVASVGPAPVAPLNDWQNQAASTTAGLAAYTPQQVSTGYTPQQVSSGSVAGQIAGYMNPYTSDVINTSLDELNRQLAQTNQTASGQAAQAGAFGGDRAAIVNTENQRNANQIAAQTIAGLNSQNYTQASGLAEQDATRGLQADEANQYAGIQAANLNSTNERANQQAGLAGAQLNLSAANQEGNLGAQFRQATQDNLTSGYNQAYTNAYWPVSSVSTLASQLGSLSSAAPKTTTTVSPGQSTIGQIAGLGTGALGLNSLIPGGLASGVKSLFGSDPSSISNLSNTSDLDAVANASDAQFLSDGQAFYNTLSTGYARGGLAGYADGGAIDASSDGYVDPQTGMWVPALPTLARTERAPATVNPAAPTGADASTAAGPGYSANLGLGGAASQVPPPTDGTGLAATGPAPTQSDPASGGLAAASPVDQALAVNPAAIVNGTAQPSGPIPVDQMPVPAPDGLAAAGPAPSPASGGLAGANLTSPSAGGSDAAPPAGGGLTATQPPSRIDQSANPGSPIPTGGLGGAGSASSPPGGDAGQSTPAPGQGDWTNNKLGMTLLNAGLGMMASKSHTALGAIGEGGLAGAQSLRDFEANRAAQMKNDLTQATMPSTVQALTASGQSTGATDPGQAEVLRLRALSSRYTALGDGKSASAINNQLLEIAKDGRVTGADGRVYMVPNAQQLAFGVNADRENATVPAKLTLQNNEAGNSLYAAGLNNARTQAAAEPINLTVQDANGNPTNVSIPRLQWQQQNLGAGVTSAQDFLSNLVGRENPGGNPAQQNLAGSSAMGNGQFMPGTYLPLFKASYPDAARNMSDAQILATRANPQVAGDMTLRYAQQNGQMLAANGLSPTGAALGLAHQFGPGGALKIANADASTPVNVALGIPANDPLIKQNNLGGVTAGQIARTMAGTYGTNPVALPGLPQGTMQGAPYQSPEQKVLADANGKMAGEIADAGRKAPNTMGRIDVLQNAFDNFRPGVTGEVRAQAARTVNDLFQAVGMSPPAWASNNATAADTIEKEGGQITADLTRMLGSREAASVFNQIRAFTPNLSMSNGGFQVVLNSLRQGVQRDQDLANYQDQWLADPKNHGSINGMQQAFNQDRPIETYASRVMPYPFKNDSNYLKDGAIYRMGDGSMRMYDAARRGTVPVAGS